MDARASPGDAAVLAGSETSLLPGADIEELRVHDGRRAATVC